MSATSRSVTRALTQYRAGKLRAAWATCHKVIQRTPNEPGAHLLLGRIAVEQGKPEIAVRHLEQVLVLDPHDVDCLILLGKARMELDQPAEAIEPLCDVIDLEPQRAAAWSLLGLVMVGLGRHQEAVACARKVVDLAPSDPQAVLELGNGALEQGVFPLAVVCYKRLLQLQPDDADVRNRLGVAQLSLGRTEAAASSFRAVLARRPGSAAVLGNLGDALSRGGHSVSAEGYYREAVHHAPKRPEFRVKLGYSLVRLGRLAEAERQFTAALRHAPGHLEASTGLATVLERRGRYRQALDLIQPLVGEDPPVRVVVRYASLCRHLGRPADAVGMVEQALVDPPAAPDESLLRHALGDLRDAMGEPDAAFAAYQAGNQLRGLSFDPDIHHAAIDILAAAFPREVFEQLPRPGISSDRPVLVVGMPRSGTSLVEQILAAHPEVHGAGELEELRHVAIDLPLAVGASGPYYDALHSLDQEAIDAAATRYLRHLESLAPDAARVTDKMPNNFLHLGLAAVLLPGVRVIHCVRDPLDTCLSAYFQNFSAGLAYTTSLEWLGAWYRDYQRLMAHWREVLPVPMHEVRYEEMVDDPARVSRELVEFCGLEWDERCDRFHTVDRDVHTASFSQVRRPIYRTSVGRAAAYAHHLEPLRRALAA